MDKRLQAIASRRAIRVLEAYGFTLKRSKGSHLQYVGFVKINDSPRWFTSKPLNEVNRTV